MFHLHKNYVRRSCQICDQISAVKLGGILMNIAEQTNTQLDSNEMDSNHNFDLPSNKKFGYFFTSVFFVLTVYFYYLGYFFAVVILFLITMVLALVTYQNAESLQRLNIMWMRFGLLLGMIVSPIILGLIFFGLFTPIAIVMRLSRRDELNLKPVSASTYWKLRSEIEQETNFENQF